jgi:hypothetical protein
MKSNKHRDNGRFGGFCKDVDSFDAELFRFAPAEAAATDPAQRTLMQQTLLALSDAAAVMGSEVGAFTGEEPYRLEIFGTAAAGAASECNRKLSPYFLEFEIVPITLAN